MCHRSIYDDDNIPEIDLPGRAEVRNNFPEEMPRITEPLPERSRPRKDGPGGN